MNKIEIIKKSKALDLEVGSVYKLDSDGDVWISLGGGLDEVLPADFLIEAGYAKEYEEPKQVGRFKPKEGEVYFFISDNNIGVLATTSGTSGFGCDTYRVRTGNCYRTKKEAETARTVKEYITKINDYIDEQNDGWVPDWNDTSDKYNIYYHHPTPVWDIDSWDASEGPQVFKHIKSYNIALEAISKFKDELEYIRLNRVW